MKKVLVVAAHPDDEVLGVGGTIARHIAQKDEVYVVIMAQGAMSRGGKNARKELKALYNQAHKAVEMLGVTQLTLEDLPDQQLDTIPKLDLYNKVAKHIKRVKPSIVYTHNDQDLNWDHRLVSEATMWACRPSHSEVKEIYLWETPSSTEWSPQSFVPQYYVDITNQLEKKVQALLCYKDEVRDYPHPRSPEGITTVAKYRGMTPGVYAAEAFKVFRVLR